jgi:hypothetical protein
MSSGNPTIDELLKRGPSLGDKVVLEGLRQLGLPGQYARGALAGAPGTQASPEQLMSHYGLQDSALGRLGVGMATDPLTYAGTGLGAARELPAAIAEGGSLNPLIKAMGQFAADDSGALDWGRFAAWLPHKLGPPEEALRSAANFKKLGPRGYFESMGLDYDTLPAVQAERVGEQIGIPVNWMNPRQYKNTYYGGNASSLPSAWFVPQENTVYLPTNKPYWLDPAGMAEQMKIEGAPQGEFPPWSSTSHPFHTPTHEFIHGLHFRESPGNFIRLGKASLTPEQAGWAGRVGSQYARVNPLEAVAELGTRQLLDPGYVSKPFIEDMMRRFKAPDLSELGSLIPK